MDALLVSCKERKYKYSDPLFSEINEDVFIRGADRKSEPK